MLKKFYPRISFPGDVWTLNDGVFPDGKRAFSFKTFLDNNYKKLDFYILLSLCIVTRLLFSYSFKY